MPSTDQIVILPEHTSELAELKTKADRVRYALEHLGPQVTTAEVRAWLAAYGTETTRTAVSKVVNAWRRERGLTDTGGLRPLDDAALAELDAFRESLDESSPDELATLNEDQKKAPVPQEGARGFDRGLVVAWLAFALGGLVSVAANVAHTAYPTATQLATWVQAGHLASEWRPEPGAMIGAAFWPLALVLAVEVISRVSWARAWQYAVARYFGASLVAVVAAVMSYQHMAGLLAVWGEDEFSAHLGPLAVDGLMLVAATALLSLSRTRKTIN